MTDYEIKTVVELKALCKEKGIKGYSSFTKSKLIELLKENHSKESSEYDKFTWSELVDLCKKRNIKGYKARESSGKVISTKEKMIQLLKENYCTKTAFQYLTDNYPLILSKFVGDQNNLKTVSHGTNKIFTWKCDNLDCLNTYKQSPCNIYRQDFPRKYCDKCSQENRYINKGIAIIKRSGSIQDKFPSIEKIWSKDNIKTSNEFSPGSNERVKL